MVAFDPDRVREVQPLDYALLRNGPISVFWRSTVLGQATADLAVLGYTLVAVDAASWSGTDDLHEAFAGALGFPSYYGRNLDALSDCLADVAEGAYGWDPTSTGLAVVVHHFDAFGDREPATAGHLLDIAADQARTGMLFGHRILWLIQVDDPHARARPVGATTPAWNPQEWSDAGRQTNRPT